MGITKMSWFWFASVTIMVAAVVWWWNSASGIKVKHVEHLGDQLRILLKGGYDGGWMSFEHDPTGLSVRFTKYIVTDGIYGVKLVYPKFGKNEPFAADVRRVLAEASVPYAEETGPGIHDYILGDFVHDAPAAAGVLHRILADVYKLPEEASLNVHIGGIDYAADVPITKKRHPVDAWVTTGGADQVESPGTLSELGAYIGPLMRADRAPAFLIVTVKDTEDFVQFTASTDSVQFDLPLLSDRQKSFEDKLRKLCADHGLSPFSTQGSDGTEFLDCDISGRESEVTKTVGQIILRLFDITNATPVVYTSYAFRPDAPERKGDD